MYGKSAYRSEEPGVYLSDFKSGWKGDSLEERPLLKRLGLHAYQLRLDGHEWTAPFPRDMKALLKQMAKVKGLSFPTLSL
jgi:hypothetical protein